MYHKMLQKFIEKKSLVCCSANLENMQLHKPTSSMTMAANGTNEFKIIKFIKIQIISKVKRYRFVLKCYQDRHKISKKSASYVHLYVRSTSFLK